jgi:hypothetical protein
MSGSRILPASLPYVMTGLRLGVGGATHRDGGGRILHRDHRARRPDREVTATPLHGALIKNEQDVHLFERLTFIARREGR